MKDKNTYHNNSGFKVPAGYFDNLEDQLINVASLKSQLDTDHGFKVPDGYFDSLTDKLLSNQLLESKEPKVVKLNWWQPAIAVAASVVVLLSLNIFNTSESSTLDFAQLETSEIEEFITYQPNYVQDESLEFLFAEQPELLEEVSIREELSEEELYNYLLDDLELNEIIIE